MSVHAHPGSRPEATAARVRDELERRGVVWLRGFLAQDVVAPARNVVRRALEDQGVLQGETWSLEPVRGVPQGKRTKVLTRRIKKHAAFAQLITSELVATVEELAGAAVVPMIERPQLLFSLPDAESWSVPHSVWHVDLPVIPNRGLEGIQAFTFLEPVRPRGGGTVVVAGSHRLLEDVPWVGSKQIKKRLLLELYFQELLARETPARESFLEQQTCGDVDVQVVELCGEPGDVVLMNLRLLHAPAPNALDTPRVMVTQRFLTERSKQDMDEQLERYKATGTIEGS